jgi:hydrogenase large subunit
VVIEDGKIANYQAVVPTTWNSSGVDPMGVPGPYAYSLAYGGNHPLIDPAAPLEVLRTIHSYDPCMSCAVHVLDATGAPITEVRVV